MAQGLPSMKSGSSPLSRNRLSPYSTHMQTIESAQRRRRTMNTFFKLAERSGALSKLLCVAIVIAAGLPLTSTVAFAETGNQSSSRKDAAPDDYFHTGAGARYLRRADGDIVVEPLRGNITVLMGSGGNI